jgi:hypothetical protein
VNDEAQPTCIAARCLTHSLSFASALSRATPRICSKARFVSLQVLNSEHHSRHGTSKTDMEQGAEQFTLKLFDACLHFGWWLRRWWLGCCVRQDVHIV